MTLASDTALSRDGDGRYRGEVSEDWWIERGPFGGYLAAFLVRAMLAELDDPERPPRSLTVHFVDAPVAGPIEVAVAVERAGRSSTALSLRLEQDGRPIALALAGAAAWRDGEPEWADLEPPAAPPPEDCREFRRAEGAPRFQERFALRWVEGGMPGRPAERARYVCWMRLEEGGPLDHLAVTAMSDGWMPAAFSKLGRFAIVPTFDLTIHFRAPLPAPGEWLLAEFRSAVSAGGAWEEDGELWAQDGTLIAQSRQLAMMRERRG
ncbi:MAG TPA: thioesterase family protein [Solirubrobacteraceae bacterium]|nr:thioesterase family protein [Solirubrobacteraceae bacterium]